MHRALPILLVLTTSCIVEVKNPACEGETCGNQTGSPDADVPPLDCGQDEAGTFYLDADGDGFGDAASAMLACEAPAGSADNGDDCDDAQESVHPQAPEICGDKIDNDCSGADECEQSLLGHWDFSEVALETAADVSGKGHDGTLQNGATITPEGAVLLDGVDDFVEVAHDPSFAIAEGSVSLAFVTQQAGVVQGLWSKDSSGFDAGGHLQLELQADDSVQVRLQDPAASHIVSSGPLAVGALHHLAFTFGPGGMQLYVDGALAASDAYAGGIEANIEPAVFGASTGLSGDGVATPISSPASASITDVQLYSRALAAGEVAELFSVVAP